MFRRVIERQSKSLPCRKSIEPSTKFYWQSNIFFLTLLHSSFMLECIIFWIQRRKSMMFRLKSPNLLAFMFLPLVFLGAACYSSESNSCWANAQRESTQGVNPAATVAQPQTAPNRLPRSSKPLAGGEFNKFFPAATRAAN